MYGQQAQRRNRVFVGGAKDGASTTSAGSHTKMASAQPLPAAAVTLLHWQQPASTIVLNCSKYPDFPTQSPGF